MKMVFSNEVRNALKHHLPVVALESTIITHGMPYPENVNTAKKVEQVIRDNGAIPATIAFIDGVAHIGLTEDELEFLGKSKDVIKTSRRDIPVVVAKHLHGGTTVSATMIMANLAGIKVFVTGGIGGVHKKGNITFDVSADLDELSKTNVAVICAGPKAILDIPLTLEYLETKGVVVLGYETNKLPLFYTNTSEYDVDYKVDSPSEISDIMKEKWDNNIDGGILITNPIPSEYSLDAKMINEVIDKAEKECEEKNIKGKKITPFLLSRLGELTDKTTLKSNIELVLNNARLGALVAKEYYK